MALPRKDLEKLAALCEEIFGKKCFIFDPSSMTKAELREQEERLKAHEKKVMKGELCCSDCGADLEEGSTLCLKCGTIQ